MNKYELVVVLSAQIEDDQRAAALEKVQNYVTRYGGVIENVDDWGKKRLAYEIQKQKEAFYYIVNFEAAPDVPAKAEDRIRLMESVLRFLIVKKEA